MFRSLCLPRSFHILRSFSIHHTTPFLFTTSSSAVNMEIREGLSIPTFSENPHVKNVPLFSQSNVHGHNKDSIESNFLRLFPVLCTRFLDSCTVQFGLDEHARVRLTHMLEYNVVGGKLTRGLTVVKATRDILEANEELQGHVAFDLLFEKAATLGWCIEIMQAMFLVADDIMDGSKTRRGGPCWYLVDEIGMDAVNDSLILESFMNFLLAEMDQDSNSFTRLFQQINLATQLGQMKDLTIKKTNSVSNDFLPSWMKQFNYENYEKIVVNKTALYTFYLPLAAAIHLTYKQKILPVSHLQPALDVTKRISIELGIKFQIQDDYLDCFADPSVIGKIGTDIVDGKCSWCFVKAFEHASEAQRALIASHYGVHDEKSVMIIKQVFEETGLHKIYEMQEISSYQRIQAMIDSEAHILPRAMFTALLDKIHMRLK